MQQTLAYQPQQNFPAPRADHQTGKNQRARKLSATPFESFLRNWAEQIRREQQKLRKLTEMSVTVKRRFRGLTLSDLCGRYGIRLETAGRWLDYDPDLDGEIHPINIVQPALRANTNACLQSNAAINIESANASAKNKKIADRWQKVADYFERINWTEEDRAFLFDAIQGDGTMLIECFGEESANRTAAMMPNVREKHTHLAAYRCPFCHASGKKQISQSDEAVEGSSSVQCPKCGKPADGIIEKLSSYELEESETADTTVHHRLISFYNFCVDGYGAKNKGIDSAKFLQIHRLIDRAELEADYPQFNFGSPEAWSYQLQCDYALANSDWQYLNGTWTGVSSVAEFDRFERREIYLHEEAYANYVAPEPFDFVNGKGEKVFDIKTGETIGEAFERLYDTNPCGFKFVWVDERLVDIVPPSAEQINFRRKFSAVHWLRDSSSFFSSPNYSIVIVQDDITLLNTMNHNIIARNAVVPVYYDSMVFEEDDFRNEFVPTKNAALLPDRDISKGVTTLPIPTPSPHLSNQLQFLWSVKDTITQVQPAMRGEQQSGETYGAQRQQLEQSYGLLTSGLKSFAQAKVRTTKHKFEICKDKWTLEQFQRVAAMFGEEWTDEDVSDMCESDFEADLIIDYAQGSEMPQSNLSREMKFFQGLGQLLPFVQANPELIGSDKMQKILEKIDEYADFDFDLTGLEVDELIAQKRLTELTRICKSFGEINLDQIETAKQIVVGYDEEQNPVTKMDTITEQIFHSSEIRFSRYENLEQQGKFFTENLRSEIGREKPNYLLIEMLQTVLGFIEEAITQAQTEAQQKDPQYQAQMQAQQQQAQMAEQQAAQDQAAQSENDDKKHAQALQLKSADHDAQLEKMQMQQAADAIKEQEGK